MSDRTWLTGLFAAACLLLAIFTFPLVSGLGSLMPDHWDPYVFSWVMGSATERFADPATIYQGNVLYPHGLAGTYSEPLLLPALLFGPVWKLSSNPILAYNVTLLLFWALSALTAALLAREITGSRWAATFAGLAFILCPYRLDYYLEFQMQLTVGLPVAWLGWYRFLVTPRWRFLLLTLLGLVLTLLASLYYLLIIGSSLVAFTLAYAMARAGHLRRAHLARSMVAGVLFLLVAMPVVGPYLVTRSQLGFERVLEEQPRRHYADVLTYLQANKSWLYDLPFDTQAETSLFVGVIMGALCLAAFWWARGARDSVPIVRRTARWAVGAGAALFLGPVASVALGAAPPGGALRYLPVAGLCLCLVGLLAGLFRGGAAAPALSRREWVRVLAFVGLFAFALSLGPDVLVDDRIVGPGIYGAAYDAFPPFRAIRVTTRFAVVVMMAATLLAALGLSWARDRFPRHRRLLPAAAVLLMLLDFYGGRLPYEVVDWPPPDPAYELIRSDPEPGVLMEIPLTAHKSDAPAMHRSLHHGKYLVNGISGFVPPLTIHFANRLQALGPSDESVDAVAEIAELIHPMRYLLVRPAALPSEGARAFWDYFDANLPPGFRSVSTSPTTRLYEFDTQPRSATTTRKLFSYDFAREHPILEFTLTAVGEDAAKVELFQRLSINGTRRETLEAPVSGLRHRLDVADLLQRAAANEVRLDTVYRRVDAPDGPRYALAGHQVPVAIRVATNPLLDEEDETFVEINGYRISGLSPGYTFVTFGAEDPVSFRVRHFPTQGDPDASRRMRRFVRRLAGGTVVAAVTRGDAAGELGDEALVALRLLGGEIDLRDHGPAGHALIGVKGADPGTAKEAIGLRALVLEHGGAPADARVEVSGWRMVQR